MKITVNQLRRIIKEEISRTLKEVVYVDLPTDTIMKNLQGNVDYAKANRRSLDSMIQSIESGDWKSSGMLKDFEALKRRGEISGDSKEELINKIKELWGSLQPQADEGPSEPEDVSNRDYLDRIARKRDPRGRLPSRGR